MPEYHVYPVQKTGFAFSFLDAEKPTSRNTLDLLCVALARLADSTDPVIIESWRALDRQFKSGEQHGFKLGYEAGLQAAQTLALDSEEIQRIAQRSQR